MGPIRADGTKRVPLSSLPTADRDKGLMDGRDDRSFVARVLPADLAEAGMADAAGHLPAGAPVLLFVDHGTWTADDLLTLGGLGNGEPRPPPEPIGWALTIVPPGGGAGWIRLTTTDDCVRG